jgi:hypothetical protein
MPLRVRVFGVSSIVLPVSAFLLASCGSASSPGTGTSPEHRAGTDAGLKLGDAVISYFQGKTDRASVDALVASTALKGLDQMLSSLVQPTASEVPETAQRGSGMTKVLLEFTDAKSQNTQFTLTSRSMRTQQPSQPLTRATQLSRSVHPLGMLIMRECERLVERRVIPQAQRQGAWRFQAAGPVDVRHLPQFRLGASLLGYGWNVVDEPCVLAFGHHLHGYRTPRAWTPRAWTSRAHELRPPITADDSHRRHRSGRGGAAALGGGRAHKDRCAVAPVPELRRETGGGIRRSGMGRYRQGYTGTKRAAILAAACSSMAGIACEYTSRVMLMLA